MNTALVNQDPVVTQDRLSELGLTKALLLDVLKEGAFAYNNVSKYAPVTAPGFYAWSAIVQGLRQRLCATGKWKSIHESGLEKVRNSSIDVSIICTSGNRAVGTEGEEGRDLLSKNEKGGTVERTLEYNRIQTDWISNPLTSTDYKTSSVDPNKTWILIHHIDTKKNEIRAELAFPVSLNRKMRISEWVERIYIGKVHLDETYTSHTIDSQSFTPEIEIPVVKKRNE